MARRGIYITANDRVIDQAIALLNSIRYYDSETPVVLIPYDDHYAQVLSVLNQRFGVECFDDLELVERLSVNLQQIFGDRFFARPNQFRKQACWFGSFNEFLYIDTDIVVFEPIASVLNHLATYDFICCDYQHRGGIQNVFTEKVLNDQVFSQHDCQDIFNGGFWGSKKGLISEQTLYSVFQECADHPDYFDFSQKTSDQPIINYMVLKQIPRRCNLVRDADVKAPGSWAGSPHFVEAQPGILVDPKVNQRLQYLHWAGIRIEPGCPYWSIWEHYRYLHEPKPRRSPVPGLRKWWRSLHP